MRAGRAFGVILHAERGQFGVPQAFDRLVVEVDVRDAHGALRQAVRVHGEPVILRGDFDAPGRFAAHRLVGAPVTELQLECPAAQRQAHELMAKANAEDRRPVGHDQPADGFDRVRDAFRIARAVG